MFTHNAHLFLTSITTSTTANNLHSFLHLPPSYTTLPIHPKISRTSSARTVSADKKTVKGARLQTRSSSEHARPVRLGAAGRSMSRIARMGLDDDDDDDDDDGDGKRKASEE